MGLAKDTIAKRIPRGFKVYDPARSYKQAFSLARAYPPDMPAIVVKTGKKGDVFPYSVCVREEYGNKNATKKWRKILNR